MSQASAKTNAEEASEIDAVVDLRPPLSAVMYASIPKSTDAHSPMYVHFDSRAEAAQHGNAVRGVVRHANNLVYARTELAAKVVTDQRRRWSAVGAEREAAAGSESTARQTRR